MRFWLTLNPSLYSLIFIIGLVSCEKSIEEERTYSENTRIESYIKEIIKGKSWVYSKVDGVYHIIKKPTVGYQVNRGDTVTFWYKGYTLDGKVFDTNIKAEAKKAKLDTTIHSFEPLLVIAGKKNLIDGLDDGLLLLCEHEVATILFPSSLGFKGDIVGPVSQWSPLAYDIEVIKVNGKDIQKEKSYIEGLNLVGNGYSQDSTGLFYKFITLGSSLTPTINDTIYGWYKGTLPDGTVIRDLGHGNQQIILSNTDIPEGVKYGFMLAKIGSLADLVIPSFLGFGNKGLGIVGPYQTTFYQIRLDSIKLNN